MRYAILADIHSNLEALKSVIKDIGSQSVDRIFCAGDIVGYGPHPDECVRSIKDMGAVSVLGNHDAVVVGKANISRFNDNARGAAVWTKKTILEEYLAYIRSMPAVVKEPGLFTVAHGTLDRPEAFDYMIDSQKARSSFSVMETPILFIGHTHVPGVFELKKDAVKYYSAEHVPVRNKVKYIINVGSIGQPRDGDNRASYAILDRKKMSVNIRRVEYDIARTQEDIIKAGLPEFLAERLEKGL